MAPLLMALADRVAGIRDNTMWDELGVVIYPAKPAI